MRLTRPLLPALLAVPLAAALVAGASVAAASDEPGDDQPEVIFAEDFSGGEIPDGWTPVEGDWEVVDGRLVGVSESSSQQSRITFGPSVRDYRVEVTVRFEQVVDAARWTAVALDIAPDGSTPWWIATMRSGSSAPNGLEFAQRTTSDSWNVTNTAAAPSDAGTGRDVRVAVEVRGSRAIWIFDDEPVMSTAALQRSADGVLGLVVNGAQVSFDDVVVYELDEEPIVRPDGPETVPAVVAHRGYSSVNPENTLAAVEASLRTGAEYVEIDVHSTADGVPVLLHDATLDRTTDGSGPLADATYDEVSGLDAGTWFASAFAGQPVPTFAETLELFDGRAATMLLEIKGPETYEELETIIDVIRERDQLDQVLLQSFDEQVIRDAREIEPDLRLGLLRSVVDADPVAVAENFGVVAYNPSWNSLRLRPDVVAELNAAGIAVMPYTINDPEQWAVLRDLGVDAIITDHPARLIGWGERHVQTVPDEPAVLIVSPADDGTVTRGDVIVPAVATERADEVEITFADEPVEEGEVIDVDALDLGEHAVTVTARGAGGTADASATVTVEATAEGLIYLATQPDVDRVLRDQLLRAVDRSDWPRVAALAERGDDDGTLPAELAEVIAADADALQD